MPEGTTPVTGGLRYDEGKPRYDLIPPEFLEALAVHYAQGARKYEDRNWEKGMPWSKIYRPLISHALRWFMGQSHDVEDPMMPGYRAHHMVAVAWNAIAAYVYDVRGIGKDDRPVSKGSVPAKEMVDCQPLPLKQPPTTVVNEVGWYEPPVLKEDTRDERAAPQRRPFTFWYLATPYSKYPGGHDQAFNLACRLAAALMRDGVPVFAPIAHSHPVSKFVTEKSNTDHDFWMKTDAPMIDAAGGLIVYQADGWQESSGVQEEIMRFRAAGKPVVFWDRGVLAPLSQLAALAGG